MPGRVGVTQIRVRVTRHVKINTELKVRGILKLRVQNNLKYYNSLAVIDNSSYSLFEKTLEEIFLLSYTVLD